MIFFYYTRDFRKEKVLCNTTIIKIIVYIVFEISIMGIITLRATWIIMPINHVGRLYALAFTRDGFTISYTTLANAGFFPNNFESVEFERLWWEILKKALSSLFCILRVCA